MIGPVTDPRRCGAKLRKKPGQFCQSWKLKGFRHCRLHKGNEKTAGLRNGNFKNGRYSSLLPRNLAERYEAARENPELLSLSEELAGLDAMIDEAVIKIGTHDSRSFVTDLRTTLRELRAAQRDDDADAMADRLIALGRIIDAGAAQNAARDDVIRLWEKRVKLVESERRRLVDLQQMMSVEESMVLMRTVADAIQRHVKDRETLGNLSRELTQIVNGAPPVPQNRSTKYRDEAPDSRFLVAADHAEITVIP